VPRMTGMNSGRSAMRVLRVTMLLEGTRQLPK